VNGEVKREEIIVKIINLEGEENETIA